MRLTTESLFMGVDVGTSSARAGVFDAKGNLLAAAKHPIQIWREPDRIVEQSSENIWDACVLAVRSAIALADVDAVRVAGIGFDATCSLVALDKQARPLTVSPSGEAQRNVIVWMDHRAVDEATEINASGSEVLRYVGRYISPEMQTPKLLWLKRHLPETYHEAGYFFDLADYLSFRASGSLARSLCTVTCKWMYVPCMGGWNKPYMECIGLEELLEDDAARIGRDIVAPGTPLANGLTLDAATSFGLPAGTAVGASLIDAHAGAIGTVGCPDRHGEAVHATARVAYILGTSSCVMVSTEEPSFIPGLWGPYQSAMIPGLWLNEGGQSAAGAAIDYLVRSHPCYEQVAALAAEADIEVLPYLEQRILSRFESISDAAGLARSLHVLPDLLGNRSPDADPAARGIIAGLSIDHDIAGLESIYIASLCGLGYGLADIMDTLRAKDVSCDTVIMSGGASRSRLVRQLIADATGVCVRLPATTEPVLLGAAILGAVASGGYSDISAAMAALSGELGESTIPTSDRVTRYHQRKRHIYHSLKTLEREIRLVDVNNHL